MRDRVSQGGIPASPSAVMRDGVGHGGIAASPSAVIIQETQSVFTLYLRSVNAVFSSRYDGIDDWMISC